MTEQGMDAHAEDVTEDTAAGQELAARLARLERVVEQVEAENRDLRNRLGVVEATEQPATAERLSRRHLLRRVGGAAAAGAGLMVVSSAIGPHRAAADPGQPGWGQGGPSEGLDRGDPILVGVPNLGDPNDATRLFVDAENNFVFGAINNANQSQGPVGGNNRVGLYGQALGLTNCRGVYGHVGPGGAGNVGVYGHTRSQTGLAGQNAGVCGDSKEAMGVVGLSTQSTSVFGLNNGTGIAVFGYTTGTERGVLGRVDNANSTAAGVHGLTNGPGDGVLGESRRQFSGDPGNGVHGFARGSGSGVLGRNDSTGFALFGYHTGTGRAVLGRVDNANSSAPAVHGTTNGNGVGVLGEITKTTSGAHAVHGLTQSTSGNAVFGEVANTGSTANAVLGIAKGSGNAVYGVKPAGSPGDAVVGWSRTGNGAFGLSNDGIGVKAQGGRAALLLVPRGGSGPPPGTTHDQGELAADAKGVLWICTKGSVGGDGGTPTWRQALTSGVNQLGGGSATLASDADGATLAVANDGQSAQVRLVPSPGEHPTRGQAGDLFLDKSRDLWLCKGGRNWVQVA